MLVVVEGISAAGKTTWCHAHAAKLTVPETGTVPDAPDRETDPAGAARFWNEHAARRWATAQRIERSFGVAVCDTDPLKLHYVWSLRRLQLASERAWQAERTATRRAVADARLGFADLYLVKRIEEATARSQRDEDRARRRRNFELHVRMIDWLTAWYEALETVLPGSVRWNLPDDGLASLAGFARHPEPEPLAIFDSLTARLAGQT
jgi:hypothetical protein